jgi:dipeptidyl aminopeptidase/acylaminoacyl peptidase
MGSSALPREIKTSQGSVYWVEFCPGDRPRYTILKRSTDGSVQTATPDAYSVRSRVHEYGGGAYDVHLDSICFVNEVDQRIYLRRGAEHPRPLTPASSRLRYADLAFSPDGLSLVAVSEEHVSEHEVVNRIVLIAVGHESIPSPLAEGEDFYASARFSPDGTQLAWLSWNHPNMPWDGTLLWCASFKDGRLSEPRQIAGGPDESIYQPTWSPAGELFFVSDRSGWWNIYRTAGADIDHVLPMQAEFGQPAWLFGFTNFTFLSNGDLVAVFKEQGTPAIGRIAPRTGKLRRYETGYTAFESPSIAADDEDHVWFLAGSPALEPGLIKMNPDTGTLERIHPQPRQEVPDGYIPIPEQIAFDSASGRTAYGYLYLPLNPSFRAPSGEQPPLIVTAHGGPISCARPFFDPEILFWTSRGFAYFDVDYAGSTGYGTSYRRALNGQWGVADIEDCVHGARSLADRGLVDQSKLLIRGGSAGGFVALAALTFFDDFAAGASYYGIGDLLSLTRHFHKFEARTMDRLIGPLPGAEAKYRARSPLHNLEHFDKPVILLQGLEDKVVPPSQSDAFAAALDQKRIPFAYLKFEGEGHGFTKAETVITALKAELGFYLRVLEIAPTDPEQVEIYNL